MKIFAIIFSLLLFQSALCAQFGEFDYPRYIAMQRQIQNQRAIALRQQMYNRSVTRNIRFPSANNPYPNIQRVNPYSINARQRYSPSYYNTL